MVYRDNEGFQTALLSTCQPGTLILTSGNRLARHLKHRYRELQMADGKMGWASPDIFSLNAWIWKAWNMTWPSTRPLSSMTCLALWKEAAGHMPPPEPFLPDLALFRTIDETYAALARHGLPTQGPPPCVTPLLVWRREIMQTFEARARALKGFHPALLPVHFAQAIREGLVRLPEAVVLAAFEAPAPIEEALFDTLSSACQVTRLELPQGMPKRTRRIVMANRRQEVAWLTRELVMDARTIPLNRIGVVVPEIETYVPHIRQAFREIMGKSLDRTHSAYNISVGVSLWERPLVQSGLLPLRFWAEGQPRTLLLSLALSSYYGRFSGDRDGMAQADQLWRKHGVDTGLRALLYVLSDESPRLFSQVNGGLPTLEQALETFVEEPVRTGAGWVRALETFWEVAGFPVTADEADTGAWSHLKALLHRIREDLQQTPMTLPDFTGILSLFLSEEMVHVSGSEEAGIQVLGIIESRGLTFEKLYVVGLAAGSLPRPVRPLPFLDAQERQRVQGATAESQFSFAEQAFRHLLACAPHVMLVRPGEELAEPLAPSPFWTQAVGEGAQQEVDVWNAPDAVWSRATWLQRARTGMAQPRAFPPADPPVDRHVLPKRISVSDLAVALRCPFRFFVETILRVFPLDELIMGISALDRGNRLHQALALFTRRCRDEGLVAKTDRPAMEALLRACSDEVLLSGTSAAVDTQSGRLDLHARKMEHCRWMGDKGAPPGLLSVWLGLEQHRLDEGWRWLCEESPFDNLTGPAWPFSIAGRIDRIDQHKDGGFMLWDYKSGGLPARQDVLEHLIEPQILAYVQAARENRIAEIAQGLSEDTQISGGYIALKTPSAIAHKALAPKGGNWDQMLRQWNASVAGVGKKLLSGQFGPEPGQASNGVRQEKVCLHCPYRPLCGQMVPGRLIP
jgi:ATP-dependent helicase/nuclease subunit B